MSFIITLLLSYSCFANGFYRAEFLDLAKIKGQFGSESFSAEKFRSSTPVIRGQMAYKIIFEKKYLDEKIEKVNSDLGKPDDYFFNDSIYAYKIDPLRKDKSTWQLIFVPDKDGKIKEVKVHKKCCYSKPEWVK